MVIDLIMLWRLGKDVGSATQVPWAINVSRILFDRLANLLSAVSVFELHGVLSKVGRTLFAQLGCAQVTFCRAQLILNPNTTGIWDTSPGGKVLPANNRQTRIVDMKHAMDNVKNMQHRAIHMQHTGKAACCRR